MVLALDPAIKLEYAKNNWDSEAYNAGYAAFKKVVWISEPIPVVSSSIFHSLLNTMKQPLMLLQR